MNELIRCKDCKYWNSESKTCSNDKFIYSDTVKDLPDDGLLYYDYECYSAGFYTGENFGCIHGEDKRKL